MSGTRADIARAEAEAVAAKARMQETLGQLKNRLNPAIRAREVWGDLRERGEVLADDAIEGAYERPRMIAGVVAAIGLLLLRRPIARVAAYLARPRRQKWDHEVQGTVSTTHGVAGPKGDRR